MPNSDYHISLIQNNFECDDFCEFEGQSCGTGRPRDHLKQVFGISVTN